jgi:hypothetical protein
MGSNPRQLEATLRKLTNVVHLIPHVNIHYMCPLFVPMATTPWTIAPVAGRIMPAPLLFMMLDLEMSPVLRGISPVGWDRQPHFISLVQPLAAFGVAHRIDSLVQAVPRFRVWSSEKQLPQEFFDAVKKYCQARGGDSVAELWVRVAKDWLENGI